MPRVPKNKNMHTKEEPYIHIPCWHTCKKTKNRESTGRAVPQQQKSRGVLAE